MNNQEQRILKYIEDHGSSKPKTDTGSGAISCVIGFEVLRSDGVLRTYQKVAEMCKTAQYKKGRSSICNTAVFDLRSG